MKKPAKAEVLGIALLTATIGALLLLRWLLISGGLV